MSSIYVKFQGVELEIETTINAEKEEEKEYNLVKTNLLPDTCCAVGMDDLDRVRKNNPNLEIEHRHMGKECSINGNMYVEVELTEEQARNIGVFKDTFEIHVAVPKNFFKGFLKKVEKISMTTKTEKRWYGRVEKQVVGKVKVQYIPDEESIIEHWVNSGCPIWWNFNDEFHDNVTSEMVEYFVKNRWY